MLTRPDTEPVEQASSTGASRFACAGVNLIGHASRNYGIGVTLRHFASALIDLGIPVSVFDLATDSHIQGSDDSLARFRVERMSELPHSINLFCLSSQELCDRLLELEPADVSWNERLNVALVWWELPQVPPQWVPALGAFDVLLAGSWFIRELLSFSVPGSIPLYVPYPLSMPTTTRVDRASVGVPDDRFAFYFSFDPFSSFERKNPGAVLAAFKKAFTSEPVQLVVKMNVPAESLHKAPYDAQALAKECSSDPRVSVIASSGSYSDALGLLDGCCDCFVSLHRAEGLGLGPMEAMLLGKPTILTAWSGSMSYANASTACLVPYSFTHPSGWTEPSFDSLFLGARGRWAEPSISAAASHMRRIFDDSEFRESIARAGNGAISEFVERALRCDFVQELGNLHALKCMNGAYVPSLEDSKRLIAEARSARRGLKLMPLKRRLASRVPGMWRLLYGS